ncbi:hypothetical protein EB796_006606 [Bugula neritina]|uniref:Uncharacterized protein n=1 Tax=Bugula neritina TaxID=10212 RepID=A0A7J7K8X7_BUGNE|nr:hypothetical protein EB796_006606 [Bugula neritina]
MQALYYNVASKQEPSMGCCETKEKKNQPLYPTQGNQGGHGTPYPPPQQPHYPPPQQPHYPPQQQPHYPPPQGYGHPPPPSYGYPPPPGYGYPPPPGYGYPPPNYPPPTPQNNTGNTLLGAGAGLLGGFVLADALDGGLFD